MIKDSVTIMRGCFGGCTFCSITAHQGRIIQSRSQESILKEVEKLGSSKDFKGVISDIGGPTANMYQMKCTRPDVESKCTRLSCVDPTICKLLGTDHAPLKKLMNSVRQVKGIRKVFVASGIRMDLAQRDKEYVEQLAEHHVGGLLKVAPEHINQATLKLMKKPSADNFKGFEEVFNEATKKVGKPKQFLVPYFIASHPGSDLNAMIELAQFLKKHGYKPDQVQDFIPAPFDVATCMYHTGIDPMTSKPVYVDKYLKNRKLQRALLQFFKPENYFQVREALETAGRTDLIGDGCDALISENPPYQAILARRKQRESSFGKFVHQIPKVKKSEGYRPNRKSGGRRQDRNSAHLPM
jgi:uncharacterized radical SAM protein YgiQ